MIKFITTLAFLFLCFASFGQNGFTRQLTIPVSDNSPLNLGWSGGLNYPLFSEIDLNNDNVMDLFVFDRSNSRVLTFINNGNAGTDCWEYAPQYADQFPAMMQWAFLYDYNCDNKPDIFCNNFRNNGITQYRNDSQGQNINFTLVDSTVEYDYGGPNLSNILASGNLVPNLNDIDGDGDMDILGQQFQCVGGFAYYKNMSMENFGTCDSLDQFVLDTYLWGKFTLRSGLFRNIVVGSWNMTCFSSPLDTLSYNIAERDDTYASIFTIDIDGDGDKDALIGDSQADNSLLVVNGGTAASAVGVSQDTLFPSDNVPVKIHSFSAHAFVDADHDGVKDLIVSQNEYENKNGVHFYKNTGTNSLPDFNFIENNFLQNQMMDVGESSTPVLFDFDNDGLQDLIIGNRVRTTSDSTYVSALAAFRNTGTLSSPAFEFVTYDYAGLQSMSLPGQLFPAFGDLDGDGDDDMIVGQDDGKLIAFTNTAGVGSPALFTSPVPNYMLIDVGQANTPQLIDLNRDGKLDIVSGGKNGLLKYYENTGTASAPFFSNVPTNDTLGNVRVQTDSAPDGYSVPYIFQQSNQYRMLVSCMKGDIYLYGNIDGNLNGTFTVLDTILTKTGGSRYGYNLSVGGGDLNNDSLTDMLVGYYGGGIQIYYQDDNTGISKITDEKSFDVYPNPASDIIVVRCNSKTSKDDCYISDITGRILLHEKLNSGYCIFDISQLAQGSYIVTVPGQISKSRKFIKADK